MTGLYAECVCGMSLEVEGRDESSRNAIREFKQQHADHKQVPRD